MVDVADGARRTVEAWVQQGDAGEGLAPLGMGGSRFARPSVASIAGADETSAGAGRPDRVALLREAARSAIERDGLRPTVRAIGQGITAPGLRKFVYTPGARLYAKTAGALSRWYQRAVVGGPQGWPAEEDVALCLDVLSRDFDEDPEVKARVVGCMRAGLAALRARYDHGVAEVLLAA